MISFLRWRCPVLGCAICVVVRCSAFRGAVSMEGVLWTAQSRITRVMVSIDPALQFLARTSR